MKPSTAHLRRLVARATHNGDMYPHHVIVNAREQLRKLAVTMAEELVEWRTEDEERMRLITNVVVKQGRLPEGPFSGGAQ